VEETPKERRAQQLPDEEEEREIVEKIERAERVQVIDERIAVGWEREIEENGRIRKRGEEKDFLTIIVDDEEFIYNTFGDDEWAYDVWLSVITKIKSIIRKRVEEIFGEVKWVGDNYCFGCCLFFEKNGERYRVKFGRYKFLKTLHYQMAAREYLLKDFTIYDWKGAIMK